MNHKTLGQVFTPDWIVNEILDSVNYQEYGILGRKIIDPSCGDGAFLKIIVERMIDYLLLKKYSLLEIKQHIEDNVYGIEIDKIEFQNCIDSLNSLVLKKLDISLDIHWKIYNKNTLLKYKDFLGFFDYVVGNPPYIRNRNINTQNRELLKNNFVFLKGTIDVYISFFELGFKLLNKHGQLGYITPNSYLHNSSYGQFRKYLKDNKIIRSITDFKSNKVFKDFSIYTAITIINFYEKNQSFIYKEYKDDKIYKVNEINYDDIDDKDWSFSSRENMIFLQKLYSNKSHKVSDFFNVQYGFATLRDKIYIGDILEEKGNLVLFNKYWIEKDILHKIVKGSTYRGDHIKYIIFPYKKEMSRYIPISEEELKIKYPKTYKYLMDNKEELLKRDMDKGSIWYEFGRSQGIQSSHYDKIVVDALVNHKIHFYRLDKDILVYSGIFITKKDDESSWDIIIDILKSDDFYKYIQITGKDFSGGYKTITTNKIKNYLIEKSAVLHFLL